MLLSDYLAVVRGGGALGSGVALRLHYAGFTVLVTELARPRCLRRAAALAQAVYAGSITVEGVRARLAEDALAGMAFAVRDDIPVVVDPDGEVVTRLQPRLVIDARRPLPPPGAYLPPNTLVIGLGAGFSAGVNCQAVIETTRGPHLGRVYWDGGVAQPDAPAEMGVSLLRAPATGEFLTHAGLGAVLPAGAAVGEVAGLPVVAPADGWVLGLLADGLIVRAGDPVAELSLTPGRGEAALVSDQARAVGGGVLEAVLAGLPLWQPPADPDLGLP
ncbi:MAG: hypothetical protein IT317_16670 [Anaerolineales bacterium]|nr:hypothetical protein [Anaerolineales bacterium]